MKYNNFHNKTAERHLTGKDNIFAPCAHRWDTWDALMEEQIKAPSLVPRVAVGTRGFYIEEGVIQYYQVNEHAQIRCGYEGLTAEEWLVNFDNKANEEDPAKCWAIKERNERREETQRLKRTKWAKQSWDSK